MKTMLALALALVVAVPAVAKASGHHYRSGVQVTVCPPAPVYVAPTCAVVANCGYAYPHVHAAPAPVYRTPAPVRHRPYYHHGYRHGPRGGRHHR